MSLTLPVQPARPAAKFTLLSAAATAAFVACAAEVPVADDDLPAASPSSAPTPARSPTASATAGARVATAPANGYGDSIAWRGLDEGLKESAELGRPLMLVVHAAWCPRCKELKRRFFDPDLESASEKFVMVNLDQDAQPEGLRYGPDGQYIPRIVFMDKHGNLDAGLSNPARSRYKYFYTQRDDLVAVMQTALERHGTPHP